MAVDPRLLGITDTVRPINSLITPPTREPLDLDEVKKQRKVSSDSQDTLFDLWIAASREYLEEKTGLQLMTATWESWWRYGPPSTCIELSHPPLQAVVSITYDDADGAEQTVDPSTYRVTVPSGPFAERGIVELTSGSSWPTVGTAVNAFRIRYRAGYGDAPGSVPAIIKDALMRLVGHYHRFGEDVTTGSLVQIPMAADYTIKTLKYHALPRHEPRLSRASPSWWMP